MCLPRFMRDHASGEVAEWSNAPHSKCGMGGSPSGVRIPPSPPFFSILLMRISDLPFHVRSGNSLPAMSADIGSAEFRHQPADLNFYRCDATKLSSLPSV
jgi:hypothetical protein